MFHFICGEKMYGSLERLESNSSSGLRTNTVYGYFIIEPTVGQRFFMISAPLSGNEKEERQISTSEVVSIEDLTADRIVFKTQNSSYELKIQPLLA